MMTHIKKSLRHRVSLNNLATATLDEAKAGDGVMAIEWFKNGEIERLAKYCQHDVVITRELFRHGGQRRFLSYPSNGGTASVDTSYWVADVKSMLGHGGR